MILKKIRNLCEQHGITIKQLERETGLGMSTISKWGNCSPSVSKLKAVADYFGCTVDELLMEDA